MQEPCSQKQPLAIAVLKICCYLFYQQKQGKNPLICKNKCPGFHLYRNDFVVWYALQ